MANITRRQFIKRIDQLKERLSDLKLDFEDLQCDLENEIDDIEPYEGKDDLTPQQEERQEWLENTLQMIEEIVGLLSEAEVNSDQIEG